MTARETAAKAGAKLPADRPAKQAAKNEAEEVQVVEATIDGFELSFEADILNDYEMLDAANNGAPFKLFDAIVGNQKADVIKTLKGDSPRLGIEVVAKWIDQVFREIGQGNS